MLEARIRATTFPVESRARLMPRSYEIEIRAAIREANHVYGSNSIPEESRIHFTLSDITHIHPVASETLLTRNIREQSEEGGISFHAAFRRAGMNESQFQRNRYGWSGPWHWGGYVVEVLREETDEHGDRYQPASSEARSILQMNQIDGEIATFWVPGIEGGIHGITHFPPKCPNITSRSEGIIMTYRTQPDILAHEIGHLLMRSGHHSFEVDAEGREVPLSPTNLMYGYNAQRQRVHGQDLTGGQIEQILEHGQRYLH